VDGEQLTNMPIFCLAAGYTLGLIKVEVIARIIENEKRYQHSATLHGKCDVQKSRVATLKKLNLLFYGEIG